jgi:ligand-binding SRPBCC domain-containing protein
MPTYERSVRVAAPFDAVWDFHARLDGLEALTPDWLHLRVESVRGPDGDPDPDVLEAGSVVRASVQPLGVGPRQTWESHIVAREARDGAAYFRDEMRGGPFARWEHTHSFFADGDATVVRDRIVYDLPFGVLGRVAGPLAVVGLAPMFRYRHRRTRALLE